MTAASGSAVDALLQFGAAMLRAGNTASRTREWMETLARKMELEGLATGFAFDSIMATVRGPERRTTALTEIGPPGINVARIADLERLAAAVGPTHTAPEITAMIAEIQSAQPLFSRVQIVIGIGIASAGFAFLNGAAAAEMSFAVVGGALGQWSRFWLTDRHFNPYGVAALAAIAASGTYVVVGALAAYAGLGFSAYPAGFIASVLFLVPGFPLIAGLFDLMQHQVTAAVGRLAHGAMILLAVALGLNVVIAVAQVDLTREPPLEWAYPLEIALRTVASFAASSAFAMLFNCAPRVVLAIGALGVVANVLRLMLIDMGMRLAPAAFLAALVIGAVALMLDRLFKLPRLAMTVPTIVIMVPGLYAFETIVLFNYGRAIEALQAAASCAFVIIALAMGLATARFFGNNKPRY
jgi:uncharacterized membrane protein YjjP (DUF1212 family)